MGKTIEKPVAEMTMTELVEVHNNLNPDAPVKRFTSKAVGQERVRALLDAKGGAPAPAQAAAAAPRRRRTEFEPGVEEVKPPRAGSKRADLLQKLKQGGLTEAQIAEAYEWNQRDVMDALRLLAKVNGFAVYRGEDGRWRAEVPKAVAKAG